MTVRSALPMLDDLTAAAENLLPLLREHAANAEIERNLPTVVMTALKEAGLHRVYMPKRFGGYEMDWGAHYDLSRIVAQACGASGWITSLVFSHIMFVPRFPAAAQEEFFGTHPDPVLATGSAGGGVITEEGKGWRLTGSWLFLSGVRHADGIMVTTRTAPDQPFSHFTLLLKGEYDIIDTWDSEGLRGTGSHGVVVKAQYVPPSRVISLHVMLDRDPPGAPLHDSYLYRFRPAPYQKSWFLGPLLGAAEGALESYCAQTANRKGQIFGESIADQVPTQIGIGESRAELDAARALFTTVVTLLRGRGRAGEEVKGDDLLYVKRSTTFGSRLCTAATGRLSASLGISGQTRTNVVQRLYRDVRTISTHTELNWDHSMAPTGKKLLGQLTGDALVDGVETPGGHAAQLGTQI